MIRTLLLLRNGHIEQGGVELVEAWREQPESRLWLDVEGEFTDDVSALLESIGCDALSIEVSNRKRHPPKVEYFDDNVFMLFRGIARLDERLELTPQQIGLWVGENYLISAHRGRSVSIEHFRGDRAERQLLSHPGVLALRMVHYACGRYLERLLEFEDRLGDLEDGLLTERSEEDMKELVMYRSRLRILRRIFNYHQRMAKQMWQSNDPRLGGDDEEYEHLRRSLYDRCERIYSLSSMYYELCGDLVEGYISLSSHNLSNTMRVLTIITAIFVPLSFLAGLYGMNFEYMPELRWHYAYFGVLGTMATIVVLMLSIFRRVKWL